MSEKARILFVDDEKRVLNSMRGLFRREFELFLTTEGVDAVKIASENTIDVVVADQRMPGMTGVEVLGKVKELSPNTVRILLTGYADPEAVEGSINIGEVFRFLSKPCPPKVLREALHLAVEASRSAAPARVEAPQAATKTPVQRPAVATATPPPQPAMPPADTTPPVTTAAPGAQTAATSAPSEDDTPTLTPEQLEPHAAQELPDLSAPSTQAPTEPERPAAEQPKPPPANPDESSSHWQNVTSVVLSGDSSQEFPAPDFSAMQSTSVTDVGVVLFTVDASFAESVMRAAPPNRNVILATTLAKVAQTLEQKEAGVLITDFTTNNVMLQKMISTLKQMMPELVTIVASGARDTTDMISLINHGQVFRYVLKPIDPKGLMYEVNAASIKHLDLLDNPDSAKRHQVVEMEEAQTAEVPKTLNKFVSRIRKLRAHESGAE